MGVSPQSIHLLHVDDEPDLAEMAAEFLQRSDAGISVDTVTSASEGLDLLVANDYDCVVSDYDMSGRNGIEFLERVRNDYPDLPFILYTGKGSEEVASEAISAGVTDYLQKESGTDQYAVLANRIRNYVAGRRAETEREYIRDRMELALEYTDSIIFEIDLQSHTVSRLGNFVDFFDRDPDEAPTIDDYASHVVHPADRDDFRDFYKEMTNGDRQSGAIEYRTNPESGAVRWVRDHVYVGAETPHRAIGLAQDITERKEVETERERVIARVTDAIVTVDEHWRFTAVNDQAEDLYDMSEAELLGKDFWDVFSDARGTRFEEEYRRVMETREPTSFVEHYPGLDGWFDVEAYPSDDGGIAFYFVEVTEQRRRERELAERTMQLEGVLDSVDAAIWIRNIDHQFELMNQNYRDLYDIPAEMDIVGKRPSDLFDDETAGVFRENDQRVLDRQEPVEVERELTTNQGPKTFLTRITPLFDDNGKVEGMCGVATDITERKNREQRYNAIFNQTYQFTGLLEPDGTLVEANQAALEFGGLDRADVIGKKMWETEWFQHSEETRERAKHAVERAATGEFVRHELPVQGADAEEVIIDFSVRPITDEQGDIRLLVPEGRDITERKEYELELESKNRRLDAILENTKTPMYMKADNGEYLFVNRGYRELFDLEDEDIVGQTDHDIHPSTMADELTANDQLVIDGGETLETEERIIVDGEERIFLTTIVPIYDIGERSDPDDPVAVFGVGSDITELKNREQELQRERDRLDEFASVVSHDLRNPLRIAEGNLELAIEDGDLAALDGIAEALNRMDTLIEDMLSLASAGETVGETEDMELATLAEASWSNVETDSAAIDIQAEGTIQADKTRLQQLLENLLRNAIEHGGEDVTVTVGDVPNGFYVEDNGPGIPPEERDNILEPGYSTREDWTGFGLNIVHEIAEAHGWNISVTEGSGNGARFEFTVVEAE